MYSSFLKLLATIIIIISFCLLFSFFALDLVINDLTFKQVLYVVVFWLQIAIIFLLDKFFKNIRMNRIPKFILSILFLVLIYFSFPSVLMYIGNLFSANIKIFNQSKIELITISLILLLIFYPLNKFIFKGQRENIRR